MFSLLLATLALAATTPQLENQSWFCTATDNGGAIGSGNGATREQAETVALLNCNARSRQSCGIQACQKI